ncbi:Pvc16 family protein [Nocardioides euryhalodurans]|uniref:DUF4255 domain-containing protein n=1 Tax=Nocardioides euryhalodurans TaxID=2518370 RepID=A0A4V1BDV8_9ACTN|nr:Pvc16 family protein [Nocardioides euryhalodurans]QBR92472.1 DUF4255 domain-containing protein [Nocardioides euryhalodurans]
MADHRAIEVACEGLARLLRDAPLPAGQAGSHLSGGVIGAGDVTTGSWPGGAGVLPYRVRVGRTGALESPGGPDARPLPVEVQVVVVCQAEEPGTRLALAGWVMGRLHDHPVLTAEPGEGTGDTVRVVADDPGRTEFLQLWAALGLEGRDVLLLPYVLTGVVLEASPGA